MEVVGILAHPQFGMGFQPSELWDMDFDEIVFWAQQLNRISGLVFDKK